MDVSRTSNFSVLPDRSAMSARRIIDNILLATQAASKWLLASRYSFPLWPTARAHRHRIVICEFSLISPLLFFPSTLYIPFHLHWAPTRIFSHSFRRRHRRPIHDPSISHFPGKINGANFRLYRIYNATRPVIFHLPPLSVVGISARFPIAGPIDEKITGSPSSLFVWEIIRRMRRLVSLLLTYMARHSLFFKYKATSESKSNSWS